MNLITPELLSKQLRTLTQVDHDLLTPDIMTGK